MIKTPTVLILGAGASEPYGLPTGRQLLKDVIALRLKSGESIPRGKLMDAGCRSEELDEFVEALRKSGRESVDAFLENRPEFLRTGKMAMAAVLLPKEQEKFLFRPPREDQHWYQYLYNKLGQTREEFYHSQLTVISFNYDRSFEKYLLMALSNTYSYKDSSASELLKSMKIIHVHGQLGYLPELDNSGLRYGAPIDPETLIRAADTIKVVNKSEAEPREFERVRERLRLAKRIYFLGFGYHDLNLDRLGLIDRNVTPTADTFDWRSEVEGESRYDNLEHIAGSAVGLTDLECGIISQNIESRINKGVQSSKQCNLSNSISGCLSFLREQTNLG